MTRKRNLLLNTVLGIVSQVVTILCGLILPAAIIKTFGSSANGLTNSIGQFLGFISLCELGVGAVVQSSLYGPLAKNDAYTISCIIKSANKFFRIVGIILFFYVILLCLFYPYLIDEYSTGYVVAMIIGLSIDSFAKYYLGLKNNLLLRADQRAYVPLSINTITIIVNTVVGLLLIKIGSSLLVVKYCTSFIYLSRPVIMALYVKKYYLIDSDVKYNKEPINQKWNGLAQHFSTVIVDHTDTVVLTIFTTLKNVSIYSVYYMVISSIRSLIFSSLSGVESTMGNMFQRNELNSLKNFFDQCEWVLHTCVIFIYTVAGIMIIPFVMIYTKGVVDTNYDVPLFSILLVTANAGFSLQYIYKAIVKAVGHYKETQMASIIEAIINVIASVILVKNFDLVGVAIGTLLAMSYRILYLVWYIKNNIIFREYFYFIKQIIVDFIAVFMMILSTSWVTINRSSYTGWLFSSINVLLICGFCLFIVNYIFYRKYVINVIHNILNLKQMRVG